jgi:hypothetical protein
MKEMCRIISNRACPSCGHKQFVVVESVITAYATNKYGEIIDSVVLGDVAKGQCCTCGSRFEMIPLPNEFVPKTRLREILYFSTPHYDTEEVIKFIPNPMEVKK